MFTDSDYRVTVSWYEVIEGGERLFYGATYRAKDREAALSLYRQAQLNNGWAGEWAHEVQINVSGPGISPREPSPVVTVNGLRTMRGALEQTHGPVFKPERSQDY